jgi:hypothetical protein
MDKKKLLPLEKPICKDDLVLLGHMDTIKEGDIVFNDFAEAMFKVGPYHPRIGTEFDCFLDMPVYRLKSKTPTRMTA